LRARLLGVGLLVPVMIAYNAYQYVMFRGEASRLVFMPHSGHPRAVRGAGNFGSNA
jgi:hypothetical protein